jgi:hypothetical protein
MWTEVDALLPVRDRAERLLATHALAAADALQLGAALVLSSERPRGKHFITSDEPLQKTRDTTEALTDVRIGNVPFDRLSIASNRTIPKNLHPKGAK